MDPELLLSEYLGSEYIVFDPELIIKIGEKHPELDLFLKQKQVSTWAFITAYNPKSKLLSPEENRLRNQNLEKEIARFEFKKGVGRKGNWSEESYLVLGGSLDFVLNLGRKFDQNAFVYGEIDSEAKLIFCNSGFAH
ncbi:DUF3293 domain-containing protein [Leptospira sarikeiensis]|uniref:DUF3293 domain-containing protein n=1 Tax=Leptospira sarikeiensis TaxID=2484943 RepID=A0A4R9K8A7_9LEPT|nr:DUF3293 domain-containing protein [Leptospira sarikeiensis]TGL60874.1 DUF3293 domain-containing protein [Leptospira sarikeiensis]